MSTQVTEAVVAHFAERPMAQAQGLDDTGCPPTAERRAIVVETVTGEREELYWGKVPEKLRRQAVDKAMGLDLSPAVPHDGADEKAGRKRKRRRG